MFNGKYNYITYIYTTHHIASYPLGRIYTSTSLKETLVRAHWLPVLTSTAAQVASNIAKSREEK